VTSEPAGRLRALGFDTKAAQSIAEHLVAADEAGKVGHGVARIDWLASQPGLDPEARPACVRDEPGFQRWEGRGALGYLTLAAICDAQLAAPPEPARVIVASECFPTGVLGLWVRRLAEHGLVGILTATSPRRLAHPAGGPPLAGTNPLAIGIPSSDGRPLIADVSMGKVTYGDVLTGAARTEDLVPFGGQQAHKAFALALGLQLVVEALAGTSHGAVLVVARPEADPVPVVRELAAGFRLPGDRFRPLRPRRDS
jgi:LDH2 family malate/lactate/ureidoglycolate dehydrogenase